MTSSVTETGEAQNWFGAELFSKVQQHYTAGGTSYKQIGPGLSAKMLNCSSLNGADVAKIVLYLT